MKRRKDHLTGSERLPALLTDTLGDLDRRYPPDMSIHDLFVDFVRLLESALPINRALLAVREPGGTRFIATTTISERRSRKHLSVKLPTASSLFEKVAEHGIAYSETFCECFSGNRMERNLLLDDDSRSFALVPLKHEGSVVGIMGLSSDEASAFALVEDGLLERTAVQLAARIIAATL
jgi:hypothetical protein